MIARLRARDVRLVSRLVVTNDPFGNEVPYARARRFSLPSGFTAAGWPTTHFDGKEETVDRLAKSHPTLPVILVTAFSKLTGAVDATKRGAFQYIAKPYEVRTLEDIMAQAIRERREGNAPALAEESQAELVGLQAIPLVPWQHHAVVQERSRCALESLMPADAQDGCKPEYLVRWEHPVEAIRQTSSASPT